MVLVNESVRPTIKESGHIYPMPYKEYKISNAAMNPLLKHHPPCSWRCHHTAGVCGPRLLKPLKWIVPIYNGIIASLQSFGNYVLANIVFLVLLWPLIMFFLLIKCLDMQQEIKKLKEI